MNDLRERLVLYPLLFAEARVLYIAANNPGQFALTDLLLVVLVTAAFVAALQAVGTVLLRGYAGGRLPALATFLILAWIFGGPPVEEWLDSHQVRLPPYLLPGLALGATVLLAVGLARRPRALAIGAKFLTVTYALLVLFLAVSIGTNHVRAQRRVQASALAANLAEPLGTNGAAAGPVRDVYVLVLDEYANSDVLREVLGFDNRAFEDSLRALGFRIPASVSSNYAYTSLSLPSFLNAAHVTPVEDELPPGSTDPTLLNHLVARNRVAAFLQQRGYRFVFFPSSWWNSTRTSPIADSVVRVRQGFSLGRELARTEFRRVIRQSTLFGRFYRAATGDREMIRGTLERIARLPASKPPVFAFAHLMSPHGPYLFDRTCGERPPVWRLDAEAYLAQLECLNSQVLAAVTRLIADSDPAPIIVLQGDHGTAFRRFAGAPEVGRVSPAAAWERFGAFGAYYLPGAGGAALGDTVTVVNVLGTILRAYFAADVPLQPDDHFLSLDRAPFRFRRMDSTASPPSVTAGTAPPDRAPSRPPPARGPGSPRRARRRR